MTVFLQRQTLHYPYLFHCAVISLRRRLWSVGLGTVLGGTGAHMLGLPVAICVAYALCTGLSTSLLITVQSLLRHRRDWQAVRSKYLPYFPQL